MSKANPPDTDLLIASILFLMTRYARQPNPQVSSGIEDHLQRLQLEVSADNEFLSRTAERLLSQWQQLSADDSRFKIRSQSENRLKTSSTLH